MTPILVFLLVVVQNVLANNIGEETLAEVMKDAAVNLQNSQLLKEKFLIPYVRNVYDNLKRLDNILGNIRFLVPETDHSVDGKRIQRLVFNTSEIVIYNTTISRLVLSSEHIALPATLRVSCRNLQDAPKRTTRFGIIVDITKCLGSNLNTVVLTIRHFLLFSAPFEAKTVLAVFDNFDANEVAILESENTGLYVRHERSLDDGMPLSEFNSTSTFNPRSCSLKYWEVDFNLLGWTGFLLLPPSYEANVCEGICPLILTNKYYNASSHSLIKNFYHYSTNLRNTSTIPLACCVPKTFAPLDILIFTKSGTVERRVMDRSKVMSCECS